MLTALARHKKAAPYPLSEGAEIMCIKFRLYLRVYEHFRPAALYAYESRSE